MRIITLSIFSFIFFTAYSQNKPIPLYYSRGGDTSLFVTIKKNGTGIYFIFPKQQASYFTLEKDSIIQEHILTDKAIYGPYKFLRKNNKILFNRKTQSKQFFDLYKLSNKTHLSPDLFSSSTDSYEIKTRLLDSNASLLIDKTTVPCFKFSQMSQSSKFNRILYLDKNNLLPCKIEYYSDINFTKLYYQIFMKSYIRL